MILNHLKEMKESSFPIFVAIFAKQLNTWMNPPPQKKRKKEKYNPTSPPAALPCHLLDTLLPVTVDFWSQYFPWVYILDIIQWRKTLKLQLASFSTNLDKWIDPHLPLSLSLSQNMYHRNQNQDLEPEVRVRSKFTHSTDHQATWNLPLSPSTVT